jgi:hypothetical protein
MDLRRENLMKKLHLGFRPWSHPLRLRLFLFVLSSAAHLSWSMGGQKLPPEQLRLLSGPFDLAAARTQETPYFLQETQFIHIGFDGKRTGTETYILRLQCLPAKLSGKGGDEYTCREFRLKINDGPELTVPSLAGWSYVFTLLSGGEDEKGQVLGIPHAKFEGLTDSRGNKLGVGVGNAVYKFSSISRL